MRGPASRATTSRRALALIAVFALARLAFAAALGPGYDEAYTIVVARRLDLSYFDHPPLHQWIAHFAALALGEGAATRLPFIALFAATGWLMFALTRRLFDARAGLIALVALNLTPFFFASAGTWVVPDGPLDFALAGAAATLARLFFDPPTPRAAFGLWLAAGLWLGLAGLSKYNAVLPALGVARLRRARPAPAPLARASGALSGGARRARRRRAGAGLERAPRLGLVRLPGRARRGGGPLAAGAGRGDGDRRDRVPVALDRRAARRAR